VTQHGGIVVVVCWVGRHAILAAWQLGGTPRVPGNTQTQNEINPGLLAACTLLLQIRGCLSCVVRKSRANCTGNTQAIQYISQLLRANKNLNMRNKRTQPNLVTRLLREDGVSLAPRMCTGRRFGAGQVHGAVTTVKAATTVKAPHQHSTSTATMHGLPATTLRGTAALHDRFALPTCMILH
jgi:hypothetical protein